MNNTFINNDAELNTTNNFRHQVTTVNVGTDYGQSAFGGEMLRAIHEFLDAHPNNTPLHIVLA